MKYRIIQDVRFVDQIIPKGTVIQSIRDDQIKDRMLKKQIINMRKRAKKQDHNCRLVAFYHPEEKLRAVEIGVDAEPVRVGVFRRARRNKGKDNG